ncbi:MAG: hypothetical protein BWY20_02437 [Spirochaetes bacterium ADurb.Bin215]|nr:MAG: hypothetical protein BWY20_02437 [Spirochaetes bacterium ADurb.Bin215]
MYRGHKGREKAGFLYVVESGYGIVPRTAETLSSHVLYKSKRHVVVGTGENIEGESRAGSKACCKGLA